MAKKYSYTDNILYYSDGEVQYKIREINTLNKIKIAKLILKELLNKYKFIDCSFNNLIKGYAEEI